MDTILKRIVFLGGCVAGVLIIVLTGCTKKETASTDSAGAMNSATEQKAPSDASGGIKELKIEDTKVGSGAEAQKGKKLKVHYTGYLLDGTKFDSSVERNEPFEFIPGESSVIQGWQEGFIGMKVGGKRKLTIPADKAYGERGAGNGLIPPGATLVFDVELLGVK